MKNQLKNLLSAMLLSMTLYAGLANTAERTVQASDLDLRNPVDAAVLYERIKLAAAMICRTESASWDAKVVRHFNRCKNAAIEDAVARINQPLLTAVHQDTIDKVAKN